MGVIPLDYDDLVLIERGPGYRFLESSRMASMKKWQHERVVRPAAGGCELRDTVRFEMRSPLGIIPGATGTAIRLFARIFDIVIGEQRFSSAGADPSRTAREHRPTDCEERLFAEIRSDAVARLRDRSRANLWDPEIR